MPKASYLTKAALAVELMIGESTVDDYVRRGLLPSPIRISPSCVRWRWATVDEVLRASEPSLRPEECLSSKERVARAIEASKRRSNSNQAEAEGVARVLAAARERSRAIRRPKS
jgi:predicted DNA-binding transcriptional regulator AlpA